MPVKKPAVKVKVTKALPKGRKATKVTSKASGSGARNKGTKVTKVPATKKPKAPRARLRTVKRLEVVSQVVFKDIGSKTRQS